MSAQLSLDGVTWVEAPVPTHESRLALLMDAVSELLDDDGNSAPTTRTLAEHFAGESSPPGSPAYVETAAMMEELAERGAVDAWHDTPGYFARDDDGPTVTRWTRTRAAIEVTR